MGKGKLFKVIVARPAIIRYQERVLTYLFDNFSFERATEIDENIIKTASTLSTQPARGRKEKYLSEASQEFRFILHRETKHFEIKIIYYINEEDSIVYITDLFPTRMDPLTIKGNH